MSGLTLQADRVETMRGSSSSGDAGIVRKAVDGGAVSRHQRLKAAGSVEFKHVDGVTRLDHLYQQGNAKIRFPRLHGPYKETVLINTAGGLTGGDQLSWRLNLKPDCHVVATTQACEKAYDCAQMDAHVHAEIELAPGSILHWLPQETLLYEGSRLSRRLDVDVAEGAAFLALECVVLGRACMGETVRNLHFHDRWRVKRGGKLVFADDFRLHDGGSSVSSLAGHRAIASLLFVRPGDDDALEQTATELRKICRLDDAGFSAFDGKLFGRMLAADSYSLRKALVDVLRHLRNADLPRVWRI